MLLTEIVSPGQYNVKAVIDYVYETFYVFDEQFDYNRGGYFIIEEAKAKYRIDFRPNSLVVSYEDSTGATRIRSRQIKNQIEAIALIR